MKLLIQRVPTSPPRLNLEYRTKIFVLQILQIQIQMQIKANKDTRGSSLTSIARCPKKRKKFQLNLKFSSSQLGIISACKSKMQQTRQLFEIITQPTTPEGQNIRTLRRKGALKEHFIQPSLPWSIFRNFLQSIYNFASNYYRTRLQSNENTDTFGPLQLLLPLVST